MPVTHRKTNCMQWSRSHSIAFLRSFLWTIIGCRRKIWIFSLKGPPTVPNFKKSNFWNKAYLREHMTWCKMPPISHFITDSTTRYDFLKFDALISLKPYNSAQSIQKNLKFLAALYNLPKHMHAKFHTDWLRIRENGKINLPIFWHMWKSKFSLS